MWNTSGNVVSISPNKIFFLCKELLVISPTTYLPCCKMQHVVQTKQDTVEQEDTDTIAIGVHQQALPTGFNFLLKSTFT